jgi:hypothetical protein
MTIDLFLRMLQSHLRALQSPVWPHPHSASNGPALFLDADDTRALIDELTRLRSQHSTHPPAAGGTGAEPRHVAAPER